MPPPTHNRVFFRPRNFRRKAKPKKKSELSPLSGRGVQEITKGPESAFEFRRIVGAVLLTHPNKLLVPAKKRASRSSLAAVSIVSN
jgi:hypothetical protein